ncbi:MAG: YncE family protein [Verrucomicrobia bacterium]|nr:YncE family protein [Verrucomicrobiota bacterium]
MHEPITIPGLPLQVKASQLLTLIPIGLLCLSMLSLSPYSANAATANPVTATIDVGPYPDDIAVDPVRNFVYVSVGTAGSGGIFAIDTVTNAPVFTLFTGAVPNGMAVSPDGQLLYVTTLAGTMDVFSLDLRLFLYSYATGSAPSIPAVNRDGSVIYVPNNTDQTVTAFEGQLSPVTMPVSGSPFQVVFSPDGTHAYVGHTNGFSVIDTSSHTVNDFPLSQGGHEIAITPNGETVYVSSGGNDVYAIATATNAVTPISTSAPAGTLWGLVLDHTGKRLYVVSATPNAPSTVITIDTQTNSVLNQTTTVGFLSYEIAIKGRTGYTPNLLSDTVSVFKAK